MLAHLHDLRLACLPSCDGAGDASDHPADPSETRGPERDAPPPRPQRPALSPIFVPKRCPRVEDAEPIYATVRTARADPESRRRQEEASYKAYWGAQTIVDDLVQGFAKPQPRRLLRFFSKDRGTRRAVDELRKGLARPETGAAVDALAVSLVKAMPANPQARETRLEELLRGMVKHAVERLPEAARKHLMHHALANGHMNAAMDAASPGLSDPQRTARRELLSAVKNHAFELQYRGL